MREETRIIRELRIVNAATAVFAEKGIDNTTMQDVAKQAGLGVATVFRFFPRKEKLIVAVATKTLQDIYDRFADIAHLPITAYDKLEMLFDTFIEVVEKNDTINVIISENFINYSMYVDSQLEDIDKYKKVYRKISAIFSSITEQGLEDMSINANAKLMSTIMKVFGLFTNRLALQEKLMIVEDDLPAVEQLYIIKQLFLSAVRPAQKP